MSDHQSETEFLKRCLLYEDTAENHKLAERITAIQRDERRVRCALRFVVCLIALAAVGLCYSAIFLAYYPENVLGFTAHFVTQVFCVMGLVSIICLPVFVYLASVHRGELNQRREECREAIARLMELHLGKPVALPQHDSPDRERQPERKTSSNWETQRQTNPQQIQSS